MALLAKPVGLYLLFVMERKTPLTAPERWLYRAARIDPDREMTWQEYAGAFLLFSALGTLFLFVLLRFQAVLPGGPAVVLVLSALAVSTQAGRAALTTNGGAHGLSEIVFAHASCAANNGMSMAGISANTPFYNATLLVSMMAGRFGLAIPALALAGSLAAQRTRATHAGTVPSEGALFIGIVLATALLVGALTYFPLLALGPIVEHLALHP